MWGLALVAQAAVLADVVAAHSTHLGLINTVASIGVPALLATGTFGYVRRSRAAAAQVA